MWLAFGKSHILSHHQRRSKRHGGLDAQRFAEAHHSVVKAFLHIVVGACLLKFILVYRITARVPHVEWYVRIDLSSKFLKSVLVLIHVQVLHDVVNADLGR